MVSSLLHLFISWELDSSFWGNFKNIDSIAPPQRPQSSFFYHVLKTVQHIPFEINRTMNLAEQRGTLCEAVTDWGYFKDKQKTFTHKQWHTNDHRLMRDEIITVLDWPVGRLWGGLRGQSPSEIQTQRWLQPSAAATHSQTSSPLLKIHLGLSAAHLYPTSTEPVVVEWGTEMTIKRREEERKSWNIKKAIGVCQSELKHFTQIKLQRPVSS